MDISMDDSSNGSEVPDNSAASQKGPPFTPYEKEVLIELVDKYKHIVENKKTDSKTNDAKSKTWSLIWTQFASQDQTQKRTAKQLKKAWNNWKRVAKKDVGKNTRSRNKTGGGPPGPELKLTTVQMCSIIPQQMTSLDNEFDCDQVRPLNNLSTQSLNANFGTSKIRDKSSEPSKVNEVLSTEECINIDETEKSQKEPGRTAQRKYKDARSSLVDMEYEEHLVRLKTLALQYKLEERKLQMMEEKHSCELEILKAQLKSLQQKD